MKTHTLILTIAFAICSYATTAVSDNSTTTAVSATGNYRLELFGKIKHYAKFCSSNSTSERATISITDKNSGLSDVKYSSDEGNYMLNLDLNKNYTIRISKKGWVTEVLNVNTNVDNGYEGRYRYNFDVEMFEEIAEINSSILKKKVADIFFHPNLLHFTYQFSITPQEKHLLHENYNNYYLSHVNSFNNPDEGEVDVSTNQGNSMDAGTNNKIGTKEAVRELKIVYQIQILTLLGHTPVEAKVFDGCPSVSEYIMDGKYKYAVGEYQSLEAAVKDLKKYQAKGFKDAFPVAIINGKLNHIDGFPVVVTK